MYAFADMPFLPKGSMHAVPCGLWHSSDAGGGRGCWGLVLHQGLSKCYLVDMHGVAKQPGALGTTQITPNAAL
jgi:hypothetical protein